jgi:hypothetical protein
VLQSASACTGAPRRLHTPGNRDGTCMARRHEDSRVLSLQRLQHVLMKPTNEQGAHSATKLSATSALPMLPNLHVMSMHS